MSALQEHRRPALFTGLLSQGRENEGMGPPSLEKELTSQESRWAIRDADRIVLPAHQEQARSQSRGHTKEEASQDCRQDAPAQGFLQK